MSPALALIQETTFKTPDTSAYMQMGYSAIGLILAAYIAFLWIRVRKAK